MCVCPEFKTFKRHVLTFVCLEGDEETCDESSYSNSPRFTPGESISQALRKPKHLSTFWNSVSAGSRSFGPSSY